MKFFKLKKTEQEKFLDYVKKYREENIPPYLNQIKLCDELLNPEIDHYISISNRSDGKTYNYIAFFINFALKYGYKFILICRNFYTRGSYIDTLDNISDIFSFLEGSEFTFVSKQYYTRVYYKAQDLCLITDLNNATNLKYSSALLSKYPIIIYDEFLALEGDYLPDEWKRLKTIYSSINRNYDLGILQIPKIFYLGNAVNFSSPVLSNLNLFRILERHPMNTMQQYNNILLELHRNDAINEKRNLRAFREDHDALAMAEFEVNSFRVASPDERMQCARDNEPIYIKFEKGYLRIDYTNDYKIIILSILENIEQDYSYNTDLKDNTATSIFLSDGYFSETEPKKHDKGLYLYDSTYSKESFFSSFSLPRLKIMKIIGEQKIGTSVGEKSYTKQEDAERAYLTKTKESLLRKWWE